MRRYVFAAISLAVSVITAGVSIAKEVPLADRYFMWFVSANGYPAVLNFYWPEVQPLRSSPRNPSEIIDAFSALCLRTDFDQAKLANAANEAEWDWSAVALSNVASKSALPFRLDSWRTSDATVQVWNGEQTAFNKLPFYRITGRLLITGYVDGKKQNHILPQCNMQIALPSFEGAGALVSSLSKLLETEPEAQDIAKRYATARWSNVGRHPGTRINLYLDKRPVGEPILHIGVVQVLPKSPVSAE